MKTRLVHTLGGSRKFWEGSAVGKTLVVRWGRIGSEGQSRTRSFADGAAATKELYRLLAEKRGKGYVAQVGPSRMDRPTKARPAKEPSRPARPTEKAYRALVTARLEELRPKLVDELSRRVFPRKFPEGTKSLDYEIFVHGLCGPVPIVGYLMDGNNGQVMVRDAKGKTVVLAPNVEVLKSVNRVMPSRVVEPFEDAGVDTAAVDLSLVRRWFIAGWTAAGGKRLFPLPASIQTHDGGTPYRLPNAGKAD